MPLDTYIEDESELKEQDILLDVRPWETRLFDYINQPSNHAKLMIWLAIFAIVFAPICLLVCALMALLHLLYITVPQYAPLRYPKDLGGIDPSNIVDPNDPTWKGANGTWYVGVERSRFPWKRGREVWQSDTDLGMHQVYMGTTGSGKTQALLSANFNALCWGSGFSYTDGKADNELTIKIWTMLRRFGREDCFLDLNFLTGGADPFSNSGPTRKRRSNKANLFSEAPMDFLSELLTSMLPKAEGDGAQWQAKAINMMKAVVRVCCFQRAEGKLEISVKTLRDYMQLQKLEELYIQGEKNLIPEIAFSAIRSYMLTGISWNPEKYKKGEKQTAEVHTQHGYLTNQFLAPLSMLADTYGHIFSDPFPEVDLPDVMLRRRILVTPIPTLEKSSQEAANLGKLIVGGQRLMMGKNLGHEIEGTYRETILNKATQARCRYPITLDELGYYFAPGLDLVFAQARSLKFAMIAAGQDFAAMKKEGKDEVISMIGNTKTKIALAIEDPTETFEIFEKAAGETKVAQSSGNEVGNGNWTRLLTSSVQEVSRLSFRELKRLISGQGVIIFMDRIVRFNAFYIFSDKDKPGFICPQVLDKAGIKFKLNRYLQVYKSEFSAISDRCKPRAGAKVNRANQVLQFMLANTVPVYNSPRDHVIDAVAQAASVIPASVGATERGIALFMAACEAIGEPTAQATGGSTENPSTQPAPVTSSPSPSGIPQAKVQGPQPVAPATIDNLAEEIDPLDLLSGDAFPVAEIERTPATVAPQAVAPVPQNSDGEASALIDDFNWFQASIENAKPNTPGEVESIQEPRTTDVLETLASPTFDAQLADDLPPLPNIGETSALPDLPDVEFSFLPEIREQVAAIEALAGAPDGSAKLVEQQVSHAISNIVGPQDTSPEELDEIEDTFARFERQLLEGAK